jgi:N-acetylglutamate synthase-like GNAT family acetyltransferase
MIEIINTKLDYLDSIEAIADSARDRIAPNNRMIYFLCCTIFSKFSFIALKDGIPIGFLLAFPKLESKLLWLHQIAIYPNERSQEVGSKLLQKLETLIVEEKSIKIFRCAIRTENQISKSFFTKNGYRFIETDPFIKMEIFEKQI